jgi:hypothetical protein
LGRRRITQPADKAQQPAQAVLIRFRLPEEKQLPTFNTITTAAPADPTASMQKVAVRVYQQIGFSARDSLVGWALRQTWSVWGNTVPPILPSASRLNRALGMLFCACEELFHERRVRGMAVDVAKVKLLLDDVQDLIKKLPPAAASRRAVFVNLATLLVNAAGGLLRRTPCCGSGGSRQLGSAGPRVGPNGCRRRPLEYPRAA